MGYLTSNFGTMRGLVRLGLSFGEVAVGRAGVVRPDPSAVRRLVFVCHGNICRSAFADVVSRQAGLRVASFGLSTDSGKAAHPPAVIAARVLGFDMTAHRTCRAQDFEAQPGDLLLAMETRQLRRMAAMPNLAGMQQTLLGLYADPVMPHLHDPYALDPAYMPVCLKRIESAVVNLAKAFPGARFS
jgi:protein-tyrosine phosphatase